MNVCMDSAQLGALLRDFTLLTGIRISFWDPLGRKMLRSADTEDSEFCSRLRAVPALEARCHACDRQLLDRAMQRRDPVRIRCHADLEECAYPVFLEEELLGFFMIGQTRIAGAAQLRWASQWEALYGLDAGETRRLYAQLPEVSAQAHSAAARMVQVLARVACDRRMVYLARPPLATALHAYLHSHLTRDTSIAQACADLGISRSTLCRYMREYYGTTYVGYRNQRRVEAAKKLLLAGADVAEAAARMGFSSPSYFSRVFRLAEGLSPAQYLSAAGEEGPPAL